MSDIADESSQQINAGKGYKSVVLEDVTWEQIYSQAKVIFSDTPCSWIQLMWNNVGERKNKSKWHLKGKWKFKISSPGSILVQRWERAPIPLAIPKIRLQWPTLLLGQRRTSVLLPCRGAAPLAEALPQGVAQLLALRTNLSSNGAADTAQLKRQGTLQALLMKGAKDVATHFLRISFISFILAALDPFKSMCCTLAYGGVRRHLQRCLKQSAFHWACTLLSIEENE